jgi:hypothetical protein
MRSIDAPTALAAARGSGQGWSVSGADYTTAQILEAIGNALQARDMKAVVDLMHFLAVRDPDAAQVILDTLELVKAADE